MTYKQIRQKYIDFLVKKEHREIENASTVPENDPSILFTPAGMSPIVPYLMGEKHPLGTRLANIQRCIRTIDIEEVGDNTHLTFFEMAGNWSLNDYYKKEALEWTFAFITKELGFEIERIYASVFEGDESAEKDLESLETLREIFRKHEIEPAEGKNGRIQFYGKNKCWWELPGGGPCGPCSEIFYDTGKEPCGKDCHINCDCGKYVELGNNVFMEYLKHEKKYTALGRHNVDFGGGLARWAMFLQNVDNVFEIDINKPIYKKVQNLSKLTSIVNKPAEIVKAQRIVTEHIITAVIMLMDEVVPANIEQGYILRRLIRRAIRYARKLGIPAPFTTQIAKIVIKQYSDIYQQLKKKENEIYEKLETEEGKFTKCVEKGEEKLRKIINQLEVLDHIKNLTSAAQLSGTFFFQHYQETGFPLELSLEVVEELIKAKGGTVTEEYQEQVAKEFQRALKEHQEKSRAATKGKFIGGLADTTKISMKYHTATHLLNAALKEIVGDHIYQMGSNITTERLRFDFPNPEKLTPKQVKKIEAWVNEKIEKGLPISCEEMTPKKAKRLGAEGIFEHRYGEVVTVYKIGDTETVASQEICKGPHVENTRELGHFRIIKQENVGAGVKRIKAILE